MEAKENFDENTRWGLLKFISRAEKPGCILTECECGKRSINELTALKSYKGSCEAPACKRSYLTWLDNRIKLLSEHQRSAEFQNDKILDSINRYESYLINKKGVFREGEMDDLFRMTEEFLKRRS